MLLSAAVRTTSVLQLKDKCQFSHGGGRDAGSDRCQTRSFLMYAVRLVIVPDGCDPPSASRHFFVVFIFGSSRIFEVFSTKADCSLTAQRHFKMLISWWQTNSAL